MPAPPNTANDAATEKTPTKTASRTNAIMSDSG